MTSLKFYGGVKTIGGNKICLEEGGFRLFLDFGEEFGLGEDYFTGWLTARRSAGIKDYFEFGLVPRIKGIYSKEQLAPTDLKYRKPENVAVAFSHAHCDHISHIKFVDESIPVHCGHATHTFITSQETTSTFADYGPHDYHEFKSGQKLEIGPFGVRPIHVDHSIPGAYGFIVETAAGNIVYTGDLRLHGPLKEMTWEFIEAAKAAEPLAIITEGTRMAPTEVRRNFTEAQVLEKSNEVVGKCKGLVVTTYYSRDVDRIKDFYKVAVDNGRKFVIPLGIAHLLASLQGHMKVPDPMKDENILVYYKKKKTFRYVESDYYKWEREFMDKKVTAEEISANQDKFLLTLGFYHFGELIDIQPVAGSEFIHSMSEPFDEEGEAEFKIMKTWLDHFNLRNHQFHASGHASRSELVELIKDVNPKKVFPIHTEHPALFKSHFGNVQIVEKEKEYRL